MIRNCFPKRFRACLLLGVPCHLTIRWVTKTTVSIGAASPKLNGHTILRRLIHQSKFQLDLLLSSYKLPKLMCVCVWLIEWMDDWLIEKMSGWVNGWLSDWVNGCVVEWMDEWLSEWIVGVLVGVWVGAWVGGCVFGKAVLKLSDLLLTYLTLHLFKMLRRHWCFIGHDLLMMAVRQQFLLLLFHLELHCLNSCRELFRILPNIITILGHWQWYLMMFNIHTVSFLLFALLVATSYYYHKYMAGMNFKCYDFHFLSGLWFHDALLKWNLRNFLMEFGSLDICS